MKKTSIILVLCVCVIGLVVSLAWAADDFSFIGISWTDNPDTVMQKIKKSEYTQWAAWVTHDGKVVMSVPLYSIFASPMIDKERWDFLQRVEVKEVPAQLEPSKDGTVKHIHFKGKPDCIVDDGQFSFSFKGDTLLAYNIKLNRGVAKVDEDTGEGQFYKSLVEKYGNPVKKIRYSRVWTKKDQTLYYTAIGEAALFLSYINEKNLRDYIASIEEKNRALKKAGSEKESGAVRKDF